MNFIENWFTSALIAMFCYAGMALTLKHLSGTLAVPHILLYLFAITTFFFAVYATTAISDLSVPMNALGLLIVASILAFAGNYFDLQALSTAPNAGYAAAVKAGQIIVITVAALFVFKDQSITLTGGVGIALITVGIGLLSTQ